MDTAREPALVRDVLSACQGISCEAVTCSSDAQGDLAFGLADSLLPPDQQIIARLCEFGWLFRRAQRQTSQVPGTPHGGAVRQAFQCAVQARLADQYRTLALLQAQLQNPLPRAGKDEKHAASYLTLRRLALWLDSPMQLLRQLCVLLDAAGDLQGGQLLTMLHLHSCHGAPAAASLASSLLLEAAEPLLAATWRWLTAGQLPTEIAEDFFVVENQGTRPAQPNLWQERYSVDEARLPHFVTPSLATDILRTGKSVVFLRECCGDAKFGAAAAHDATRAGSSDALLEEGAMERAVQQSAAAVDKYLLHAVGEHAGAMRHCAAMRRFLLAGAGDFAAALLDAIGIELDGKAADTSEYSLNGGLETAVRGCSARHEPDDTLGRLRVRFHRGSSLETGWDRFGLAYELDEPLATAVTPQALLGYRRLSRC